MSDAKSGITDIFRQVNKLTHIDIKSIKEYANKLKKIKD
jgi:hypothetical protein